MKKKAPLFVGVSPRIFIAFMFLFPVFTPKAQSKISLVYPQFAPYTYKENGNAKGIGVSRISEVLNNMNLPFSLRSVPNYGRALLQIKKNKHDGFFLASKNPERDQLAVFSKPLMINRWCWFFLKGNKFNPQDPKSKKSKIIGTFMKTNTHKWLSKNKFRVKPFAKTDKLITLLVKQRIDSIFLAELVFWDLVKQGKFGVSAFEQKIEVEKPFGVYISKNFLKRNRGFMDKLNSAIDSIKD